MSEIQSEANVECPPANIWFSLPRGLWAIDSLRDLYADKRPSSRSSPYIWTLLRDIDEASLMAFSIDGMDEIDEANDLHLETGPVQHGEQVGESYTAIAASILGITRSSLIHTSSNWGRTRDWHEPLVEAEFYSAEAVTETIKALKWSFNYDWLQAAIAQEHVRVLTARHEREQSGNRSLESSGLKLPEEIDLRELWTRLAEGQGKGMSDRKIARFLSAQHGEDWLKNLKTRRTRGGVSDWRQR